MIKIFLIGMPGSGKSTVSRELSGRVNIEFVDLDKYIEQKLNKSIPQIFSESGESYFRDQETAALQEFYDKKDIIVSCGGGIILRPENKQYMNGFVVFLNPPLDDLKIRLSAAGVDNRPLLATNSVEKLYKERIDKYRSFMDFEIRDTILSTVATKIIMEASKYEKKHSCN